MTDIELIKGIEDLVEDTAKLGVSTLPIRIIKEEAERLVKEKETLINMLREVVMLPDDCKHSCKHYDPTLDSKEYCDGNCNDCKRDCICGDCMRNKYKNWEVKL